MDDSEGLDRVVRYPEIPRPDARAPRAIAVAGGAMLPATYLGMRRHRRPFVLWGSVWAHPRSAKAALAFPLVRHVYRHADAVVAYGEDSDDMDGPGLWGVVTDLDLVQAAVGGEVEETVARVGGGAPDVLRARPFRTPLAEIDGIVVARELRHRLEDGNGKVRKDLVHGSHGAKKPLEISRRSWSAIRPARPG